MNILSYMAMACVFLFIAYMYLSVLMILCHKGTFKAKISCRTWSSATVKVTLFWGVMLLVETFWWFWLGTIAHQVAMVLGGIFCVCWGLVYLFWVR